MLKCIFAPDTRANGHFRQRLLLVASLTGIGGCDPADSLHFNASAAGGNGGSGTTNSGIHPTTGGGGGDTGQTTSETGGTGASSGTGGAQPSIPACRMTCSVPADCAAPNAPPIVDESHYACNDSFCEYTGCKTTAECVSTYGAAYVFTELNNSAIKGCLLTCSVPADCATPNAPPIVDESHYACNDSFCEYTGCKTTAECVSTYGAAYVCTEFNNSAIKGCLLTCSVPADCATPNAPPIVDESHYICDAGLCEYTGCSSTAECINTYGPNYVCK